MAKFIGTFIEFKKYFNDYCKNTVNKFTKKVKKDINEVCEYCSEKTTLEAAHIKNSDRIKIIKDILNNNFLSNDNDYSIDMNEFEKKFREIHMPFEDHFYFLCRHCHVKYDNNEISDEQIICLKIEALQNKLLRKLEVV